MKLSVVKALTPWELFDEFVCLKWSQIEIESGCGLSLMEPWNNFDVIFQAHHVKRNLGVPDEVSIENHLLQANIVFFFLNLCVFLFWFCVVRQLQEKWNTAAVAKVKPASQRENVAGPVGRDGLQSWRRSCSSLFLNHIWHTLVAFV